LKTARDNYNLQTRGIGGYSEQGNVQWVRRYHKLRSSLSVSFGGSVEEVAAAAAAAKTNVFIYS